MTRGCVFFYGARVLSNHYYRTSSYTAANLKIQLILTAFVISSKFNPYNYFTVYFSKSTNKYLCTAGWVVLLIPNKTCSPKTPLIASHATSLSHKVAKLLQRRISKRTFCDRSV